MELAESIDGVFVVFVLRSFGEAEEVSVAE